MKIKSLLVVVSLLAGTVVSNAQSNLLNAKTPSQIGKKTPAQLISDNDKPLPYGYVHDKDVLMGKITWEIIDLDERVNFPLYYPIDTTNIGKDRRSLFDVLIKNIKNGKITEVYADDYFNTKKSLKDMQSTFKFRDTTDAGKEEINNHYDDYFPKPIPAVVKKNKKGKIISETPASTPVAKVLDPQYINERELTAIDLVGYRIKGFWYFDKRQSELKYRLLAICPIAPEARDIGKDNPDTIDLFWIYFPSIRDVLHDALAFNDKNTAMPFSYDHLLNSRRFNALIYKEENVFGDREIKDYMKDNAQKQLLESNRVKEKIRDFESDMWNY
ncbi:gliding motility protein GldN [Flavobacterium branchiophilum NBRC 15030 = ATCC 35035]|uniref:Protein involved in gliding motility GldN n=1 Tax=Flavobacterium branchiophilum TaxID=55197 RepID=A0A543G8P2_9FLAO|nr:gliding motility protein GldN [Flavobacterium branchiophilum]OXA76769.1 gliding motility protein GldN [Flavobacterium branchiophilum NBRC 15030 = ATCC 35035]TQM42459.1 protein involved in gliding motility GldN [Flavobacterium branchiophilum]GEM54149.1 gliding motility protein GldO [Flavobacterium branchiophilum NBRC 15030 = ATCC 35035]